MELLSANDSLAMNVFFSRVESSAEEVVEFIEEVDDAHLGLSTIRYLNAMMPSDEEVRM